VRLYSRNLVDPKHTSNSASEVFHAITTQSAIAVWWVEVKLIQLWVKVIR